MLFTALTEPWFDTDIVPPGYFSGGLLQWGRMFTSETYVSKGMELRGLSDIHTLDEQALDELIAKNARVLSGVAPGTALKILFTTEDDYTVPLSRYEATTDEGARQGCPEWTTLHRRRTSARFRRLSEEGKLARDKTYVFLCQKSDAPKEMGGKVKIGPARAWVQQTERNLRTQLEMIAREYGCDPAGVMGDEEHCLLLRKWANPSLAAHFSKGVSTVADMDVGKSIAHNVLSSDSPAFVQPDDSVVLRHDGMFHAFFVVSARPRGTDIRKTRDLLRAVNRGVAITMTVYPLDPQTEVERGQSIVLGMEQQKSPKQGNVEVIEEQQNAIRARMRALTSGLVQPLNVFTCIHVYAPSLEVLAERTTRIKTAMQAMDGLRYQEADHPEMARRLYAETCPGWAGSRLRGHDMYWESHNVADMMPVTASFTGFLDAADALLEGERGNIVGVRLYDHRGGAGTPQFAVNVGKTGSGKTADAINIVSQAGHLWNRCDAQGDRKGFMAIFDEGLAWHTTASMFGLAPVILREGNTPTVNPFETAGLPRTGSLYSEIVAYGMALCGLAASADLNELRKGLIEQYAKALSDAYAEDYLGAESEREMELARELVAVFRLKKTLREESDLADAYVEWLAVPADRKALLLAEVRTEEVRDYLTNPALRVWLRDYAFTRIDPKHSEYPKWRHLVAMFQFGRLPIHSTPDTSEEIRRELDTLGSRLQRGLAGGVLGTLLDGASTLDFSSPGIYVETSFLPEGSLLRAVAPMLILGRVRRFLVTRPRAEYKMVLFEEFKKLATIPGIEAATKESLAQFRKYCVWFAANFQAPSQIDEVNPALTDLLFGQSAQFWLHCMPGPADIKRVAAATGLPLTAQRAIGAYPMIADQPGEKASFMCLYAPTGNGTCAVGTTRNVAHPYLLYVVSSNGEVFDQRQDAMRKYPSAFQGVVAEVDKARDRTR